MRSILPTFSAVLAAVAALAALPAAASATPATVNVAKNTISFVPPESEVAPGETVTWNFEGGGAAPHNIVLLGDNVAFPAPPRPLG